MPEFRQVISAVTFPGVIFHELGHRIFCDLSGVKVLKACYFRFGNPAGYIVHEKPKGFTASFFIATGPFITGSLFALLFYRMGQYYSSDMFWQVLFYWLGFSVAVNCFPSNTDAKSLLRDCNRHIRHNLFAIFGYPFVVLIFLANSLYAVFFDVLYALFLLYLIHPVWGW